MAFAKQQKRRTTASVTIVRMHAVQVPFSSPERQFEELRDRLVPALERVRRTRVAAGGPEVAGLEWEFARFVGKAEAVAVGDATPVRLALAVLGVGRDDEVVTSALAGRSITRAVRQVGATPVFVDVDPDTGALDPELLPAALTEQTRAIVTSDFAGRPSQTECIGRIAEQHDIPIVTDGTDFFGASGTICCIRVYPEPWLPARAAGALLVTDDERLAQEMRALRDGPGSVEQDRPPRMNSYLAASLRVKLTESPNWARRRTSIARQYTASLTGIGLVLPTDGNDCPLYPVVTPQHRSLTRWLESRGIAHGRIDSAPARPASCQHGAPLARQTVLLPIFPQMTDNEIRLVVEAVRAWHAAWTTATLPEETDDLLSRLLDPSTPRVTDNPRCKTLGEAIRTFWKPKPGGARPRNE